MAYHLNLIICLTESNWTRFELGPLVAFDCLNLHMLALPLALPLALAVSKSCLSDHLDCCLGALCRGRYVFGSATRYHASGTTDSAEPSDCSHCPLCSPSSSYINHFCSGFGYGHGGINTRHLDN